MKYFLSLLLVMMSLQASFDRVPADDAVLGVGGSSGFLLLDERSLPRHDEASGSPVGFRAEEDRRSPESGEDSLDSLLELVGAASRSLGDSDELGTSTDGAAVSRSCGERRPETRRYPHHAGSAGDALEREINRLTVAEERRRSGKKKSVRKAPALGKVVDSLDRLLAGGRL